MNMELINQASELLRQAGICDKTINDIITSLDIKNHIDKYNKYDTLPKIKIHTPDSKTIYDLPTHPQDVNFFKPLNKRKYLELVEQKEPQKVAIKLLEIEDKALFIKDLLQKYLKSIGHNDNTVSFTKVHEGYELIVYDLFVNNSKERVDFISNFKNFMDKDLHKYINLDDSFNESEYDYWLSINSLFEENSNIWPDFKLVNKLNNNGIFYNIYVNSNIINNTGDNVNINTNIPSHITVQNNINPKELFINHIIENKPEWYRPGEYISIDTFYDKYLLFDITAKKRTFAKQFENILWDNKKSASSEYDKKTKYRLMNI